MTTEHATWRYWAYDDDTNDLRFLMIPLNSPDVKKLSSCKLLNSPCHEDRKLYRSWSHALNSAEWRHQRTVPGLLNDDFTSKLYLSRSRTIFYAQRKKKKMLQCFHCISTEVYMSFRRSQRKRLSPWRGYHICCSEPFNVSSEADKRNARLISRWVERLS